MQAIPLQRPLGWPSVLWSNFPAAGYAIASQQLDILSGGIAVPCAQSHPNRYTIALFRLDTEHSSSSCRVCGRKTETKLSMWGRKYEEGEAGRKMGGRKMKETESSFFCPPFSCQLSEFARLTAASATSTACDDYGVFSSAWLGAFEF